MGEELDLAEYWTIMKKNKKKLFLIPLLLVLITVVVSLAWPKTYESGSMIQIGAFEEEIIPIENLKIIVQSSTVVTPVIEKFYEKKDKMPLKKFNEKVMDVEIVTERISIAETRVTSFIRVNIKARTALKAKEINEEIAKNFFAYVEPLYGKNLEILQEELSYTESRIEEIKKDIKNKEEVTKGELGENSIVNLLALDILLKEQKETLFELENRKTTLSETLANKREFKMISEPQVPIKYSKPNLTLNIATALVLGMLLSLTIIFSKRNKRKY